MTEDEARKRWCPFATVPVCLGDDTVGASRDPTGKWPYATACLASDCMAWRWRAMPAVRPGGNGYCGLAGETDAM